MLKYLDKENKIYIQDGFYRTINKHTIVLATAHWQTPCGNRKKGEGRVTKMSP